MGRYPIFTSGLGMFSVSSPNLVPKPPQNNTTFMWICPDQTDVLRLDIASLRAHCCGKFSSSVRPALRSGPLQIAVQQPLFSQSLEHLEAHVLGASEIGIVESH